MSLEQSFELLAKSNEALAKSNMAVVESNTRVSDTYERMLEGYNALIEAGGTPVIQPVAGASEAPAARAKPGPKKKDTPAAAAAAAPAAEDDGFGEEGAAATTYSAEDVKNKLMAVKDKFNDKAPALKIINDLGYKAIPDVQQKDYAAVVVACDKLLK